MTHAVANRPLVLMLLLSSLSVTEVWAQSAPSGETLLKRMNDAFAEIAYDGVFSYYTGGDLASLRVVHKVIDGLQRERLVHLNGAPREIVRKGEEVACIVLPGDDLLSLEKSIPSGPFARAFVRSFDRMANAYIVDTFGQGRVAGRLATRVAVSPKDDHRYGYRLWVDNDTALLLRSELVDAQGNKLEIFMFNELRLGEEVADSALEPGQVQGSMVSHLTLRAPDKPWQPPQESALPMPMGWATRWLPPGFEMATADLRHKAASGQHITTLMYGDGLAAFSIYIEPMPERGAAAMVSKNGATVAVTHSSSSAGKHYLITLVGEIPVATAQKIIRSVYQKDT